jgi:hypothetical protein
MWYAVAMAPVPVHTTGINWESILTIIGSMIGITFTVFGILWHYQTRREERQDKRFEELRTDFTDGLKGLGDILEAKLSTKDSVSDINARLSRIEGERDAVRH